MPSSQPDRPEDIAAAIIDGSARPGTLSLSLDGFANVYREVARQRSNPRVVVVSLGDRLIVGFPDLTRQRYLVGISHGDNAYEQLSFLPNRQWVGPEELTKSFWGFLRQEFVDSWKYFMPIVICAFVLFHMSKSIDLMSTVNGMALTSVTLFTGIFIVFVTGRIRDMEVFDDLFRHGYLHEFIAVDRHLAVLAAVTLFGVLANAALLKLHPGIGHNPWLKTSHLWGPLTTALVLGAIAVLLASVPQYYFRRTQSLMERQAIQRYLVIDPDEDSEAGG